MMFATYAGGNNLIPSYHTDMQRLYHNWPRITSKPENRLYFKT